jgi:hypothetical protein
MGTPLNQSQMSAFTNLGVALNAVFTLQLQSVAGDSLLNTLFNVQTSGRAMERRQGVGGMGDVPKFTGAIEYDSFEPLYRTDYTHTEYAKGIAIERRLIDDEEYGVISGRAQKLGLTFDRTIEKHSVSVFANAFAAANPGADGVALCATNHPSSPTNATTQGNKGTSALTESALSATRQLMMKFKDDRGEIMNIAPDTLLVPVELEEAARVIVESGQRSGTANNDANTNRGYRIVVSRYLTDANDWFLIDSRMAKSYLNWFWRVRPEFEEDPASDYNLVVKYRGYMRYSFGFDAWQWLYGHQVA